MEISYIGKYRRHSHASGRKDGYATIGKGHLIVSKRSPHLLHPPHAGEVECAQPDSDGIITEYIGWSPTKRLQVKKNTGCVMRVSGEINDYEYYVHVTLSKTDIRKLAENFLEKKDLVRIFKKKCSDVTLKELMK